MSTDDIPTNPIPLWFKLLIIVCALPTLSLPWLFTLCPPGGINGTLLCIYPVCILLYAVLEWRCWGSRPELSWVLIVVELLTHAAMWLLADPFILMK